METLQPFGGSDCRRGWGDGLLLLPLLLRSDPILAMSPSSTRPLLPLLVVISVLAPLAVCTQGHQQNSVCRLTCCEAEPNCTAALHVACRCRGLSQVSRSPSSDLSV